MSLAGLLSAIAGVVLQGATAGGTSVWAALDPDVLDAVLSTRFGGVWALGAFAWLATLIGALAVPPSAALLPPLVALASSPRSAATRACSRRCGSTRPPTSSTCSR